MGFGELIVFAEAEAGQDRGDLFGAGDFSIASASSAETVRKLLDENWTVDLVVADMRIVDAELMDRLQATGAPPALFLVDGDEPAVERISMADNVRGYLDLPVADAVLREAILAALPNVGPKGVADLSDRDSARINALERDVERIARALNDIASEAATEPAREAVSAAFVRNIIKRRRDRERYFPAELFGDPAWDMMLDLTAARLERRDVSVSSLCIAAAVPTTTALRWIRNLCDAGLFERNTDPDDARRGIITLSAASQELMLGYLASVRTGGPAV